VAIIGGLETRPSRLPRRPLHEVRPFYQPRDRRQAGIRFLERRCLANFSRIIGYNNVYEKKLDEITNQFEDADDDDLAHTAEHLMKPWCEDTQKRFDIPPHVYLDSPRSLSREEADACRR
jgi:hypothetical protein